MIKSPVYYRVGLMHIAIAAVAFGFGNWIACSAYLILAACYMVAYFAP